MKLVFVTGDGAIVTISGCVEKYRKVSFSLRRADQCQQLKMLSRSSVVRLMDRECLRSFTSYGDATKNRAVVKLHQMSFTMTEIVFSKSART